MLCGGELKAYRIYYIVFPPCLRTKVLAFGKDSEALRSMRELVTDGNRSKMISITSGMF